MHTRNLARKVAVHTIALIILLSPLFTLQATSFNLTQTNEYNQFVHTYYNSPQGNITYLDKPIFPVYLNDSQIPIGGNWTISCPLEAGHNYRVFCYGKWASVTSTSSTAKTDYDIYVYNPSGNLETSHTEAAGVIESITSENGAFFTPKNSGNYTFVIKNDARESAGAEQATFMIIENIECNQWYTIPIEGKASDSSSNPKTTRAYEFTTTNVSFVEVYIDVPNTLDMYEARLYLMTDTNSPTINAVALPTETGLYGTATGNIGGYNFDTNASSRGVSYASCASRGQNMALNYTTSTGTNHYYLVLMGEEGTGDVELLIKTIFSNITLTQINKIGKVHPDTAIDFAFATDSSNLAAANLTYSTDNWATTENKPMVVSGQTCNASIPGQTAGANVQYKVDAVDVVKNTISASGSYSVKAQPTLSINRIGEQAYTGDNITVTGTMMPTDEAAMVTITFFSSTETQTVSCQVQPDGTFSGSYAPGTTGNWAVLANVAETTSTWAVDSSQQVVTVKEMPLYQRYATYIAVGLILALFIGGSLYFFKFSGK
ncbi:MAG TPA: hypothetical protein VLH35_03470 [Candidatus Acidoferrales bacterium]|nr:hypothetical protein [Candidatus Acidoferrales bacterium]